MERLLDFLLRSLDKARAVIAALRSRRLRDPACGEDCYCLSDGTLVPLGDLGITPTEYNLKP